MDSRITQDLIIPLLLSLVLLIGGTLGYYVLTGGEYSLFDCMYMVVITVATVGYGEIIPLEGNIPARLLTIFLILSGMGLLLYLVTQLTAFFMEGDLTEVLRRRKMQKTIQKLRGHVIVCGAGITALYVVRELLRARWDLIVVDPDAERLEELSSDTREDRKEDVILPILVGDPTDERILETAGLSQAHGVVAATEDDKENLFITVTARQYCCSPDLRVVARAHDLRTIPKLKAAGADGVVSPSFIGGMRIASEMIRPSVVSFLDIMLRDKDANLRVEEINIRSDPDLAGRRLGETDLRDGYDFLVLAVREPDTGRYVYKPRSDYVLRPDTTLVLLGGTEEARRLREHIRKHQG